MRAHQGRDRDELIHGDVFGPDQLPADFYNTVCIARFIKL